MIESKQTKAESAPGQRRRSRWVRWTAVFIGSALLSLGLGLLLVPIWLPPVLKPGLGWAGVEVKAVERLGFQRLRLQGVEFITEDIEFHADTVEALQPLPLLARWRSEPPGPLPADPSEQPLVDAPPILRVDTWRLALPLAGPTEDSTEPSTLNSLHDVLEQVASLLGMIRRLHPVIELRDGRVIHELGTVEIPRIEGGLHRLEVDLIHPETGQSVTLALGWASGVGGGEVAWLRAEADVLGQTLVSETQVKRPTEVAPWELQGRGAWGTNVWIYGGEFGRSEWWPDNARFEARDWKVPLDFVDAVGFDSVGGSLTLDWREERLNFTLNASAIPVSGTDSDLRTGGLLELGGQPLALPPVLVAVDGLLTFTQISVQQLECRLPGFLVSLDAPLVLDLESLDVTGSSTLAFNLDLDQMTFLADWLQGFLAESELLDGSKAPGGQLTGQLRVSPQAGAFPLAELVLQSPGLALWDWTVSRLDLKSQVGWPQVTLDQLELDLEDGTRISAQARVQAETLQLETATFRLRLVPATVRPFLPDAVGFEEVELEMEASGAVTDHWETLRSRGKLQVLQPVVPGLHPVEALTVFWEPSDTSASAAVPANSAHEWSVNLDGAKAALALGGRVQFDLEAGWGEVTVKQSDWERKAGDGAEPQRLGLAQEALLRVELPTENETSEMGMPRILLSDLVWGAAPAREGMSASTNNLPGLQLDAELVWPDNGRIRLGLNQWTLDWLADWAVLPELEADIEKLALGAVLERLTVEGHWADGPLIYEVGVDARAPHPFGLFLELEDLFRVTTRFKGDGEGITLTQLRLFDSQSSWMDAHGSGYLVVQPSDPESPVVWDISRPIRLEAQMEERASFTAYLADFGRVDLSGMSYSLRAEGPLMNLAARLQASVRSVEPKPAYELDLGEFPEIKDFALDLEVKPDSVRLRNLALLVAGQSLSVRANLPLDAEFLRDLPESIERLDLARSSGRVDVGPVQLEQLSRFLPEMLRAQGMVDVHTGWEPGFVTDGFLAFEDLATVPLPTSGALQEIQGRVVLEGSKIQIPEISMLLGGRKLAIQGNIDLDRTLASLVETRPTSAEEWMAAPLPIWDISVSGNRLPVVRRPGMVIRTGLDVRTRHNGTGPPRITGVVTPQESIFITDVKTLIPTGPSSPDARPPFFRVDHPILGDWLLDIRVRGNRFLRVRTPVFLGMVSVSMALKGELRDPALIGDIILAEGTIQFPFGNLNVTQGLVSLSQEDPTQPDVFVTAASRVYGYQVSMEVAGKAEDPQVLFSSNPPLGSDAILLMLTAGKLPQDELTFSNQQKATKLASYLGKSFLDSWSLKEPGKERLTMRSGESVSVGGRITYSLDYLLVDRWSLTGEYDEYDAINAGVKYRVFQR